MSCAVLTDSTFGLELCLEATTAAVSAAAAALAEKDPRAALALPSSSLQAPPNLHVWAGYAGCARRPDYERLYAPLCSLFPKGTDVRLTGDAELLTAPLYASMRAHVRECVTTICGTGSVSLLWRRDGERWVQAVRIGGWGPLLGDEGSGWATGKAAITSVLTAAANGIPLVEWQERVLAHFGVTSANDLITASCALDPDLPAPLADSERKKRIAACTRIVVGAAGSDSTGAARRVLQKTAAQVVDNLEPLVDQLQGSAVLVVAGGLGQVDAMWREVHALMEARKWHWAELVKLPDPGMSGLEALIESHM